jgi:phospholipase D1/2
MKEPSTVTKESIFQLKRNCWRTDPVHHATLLIDCANYYRAVHETIGKAQHSLFIVGWEIDSAQKLLRGSEEPVSLPFVELLARKARQNPNLQIYLLRWESSLAFLTQRDLLAGYVWNVQTPENIHICLDDTVPIGGSHHQKIILVDDELAFTGGMDIARERWDERDHRIDNPLRTDANGPYSPYHDVQVVVDGPIVRHFAELVRDRWLTAAKYEAVPIRYRDQTPLVPTWPSRFPPQVEGLQAAIARTFPAFAGRSKVREVIGMYMDLIRQAKHFIYIENQFLTDEKIARLLNRQLKQNPGLRLLVASSYDPKGIFEREGMWAGRIEFKKVLERGISPERVRMACSGIQSENGKTIYKRIHSKILVIDDRYIDVASSNINHRSMALDTECDLALFARTSEQAQWISDVRNDLISEHSGLSIQAVEEAVNQSQSLAPFFQENPSGYSLYAMNDSQFTRQNLTGLVRPIADPRSINETVAVKAPSRRQFFGFVLVVLGCLGGVALVQKYFDVLDATTVLSFLESARTSRFALPLTCLIYIVGGFVFFPVTLLSLLTAAVFGAVYGPIYGMCGALASAAVMFWVGRWAGIRGLRSLFGSRIRMVDHHFKKAGVFGVAIIRLIPIAPYSLVNLAAGVSSVRFFDLMAGTFIGFLPGFLAKGIVADSLMQIFFNPTQKSIRYFLVGLLVWFILAYASYKLAERWKKRRAS